MRIDAKRNLARRVPRTKDAALYILERVIVHIKRREKDRFGISYGPQKLVFDAMDKLQKTQVFKRRKSGPQAPPPVVMGRQARPPQIIYSATDFAVKDLKIAAPKIFRQGYLAKAVKTFPYRKIDVFCSRHQVNVFKNPQGKFDVIDALCNLVVASGISKQAAREMVRW